MNKPLLFITDDTKKDWWYLDPNGKLISPRPELIQEMFDKTGVTFYMYTSEQFLETAKKSFPELQIDKSVIDEAREVRIETEKFDMTRGIRTHNILVSSGYWHARGAGTVTTLDYTLNGNGFSMNGERGEWGHLKASEKPIYYPGDRISLDGSFFDYQHFGHGTLELDGTSYNYKYIIGLRENVILIGNLKFSGKDIEVPEEVKKGIFTLTGEFTFEGNLRGVMEDSPHYEPLFSVQLMGAGEATIELSSNMDGNGKHYYEFRSIKYEFTS